MRVAIPLPRPYSLGLMAMAVVSGQALGPLANIGYGWYVLGLVIWPWPWAGGQDRVRLTIPFALALGQFLGPRAGLDACSILVGVLSSSSSSFRP